jgi:hypothetical protein
MLEFCNEFDGDAEGLQNSFLSKSITQTDWSGYDSRYVCLRPTDFSPMNISCSVSAIVQLFAAPLRDPFAATFPSLWPLRPPD